ncbi:MAG: hypothetical protein WC763_05070 [Candidatus Paceibacterota bacterium]|jgi:hypothetical protein
MERRPTVKRPGIWDMVQRFTNESAAKTFADGLMMDGWEDVRIINDTPDWLVSGKKNVRHHV